MHGGYLIVETSDAHPDWVRLYTSEHPPDHHGGGDPPSGPVARYTAYFDDLSAARMHAHELLRRRLVDVDAGVYRSTVIEAVAAVDSLALAHRRVYLDPGLEAGSALTERIEGLRARRLRGERTWRVIGYAAVALLLIKLLLGS
jgi:hypothetical protein